MTAPIPRRWLLRLLAGTGLAGALALLWAGLWQARQRTEQRLRLVAGLAAALPHEDREPGYVSSATCQACHPDQHASWTKSYHRTMTQAALPENVAGRFDGQTISSDGLDYRIYREGDAFWAEMPDPDVMMYVVQGGKKLAQQKIPRVRRPVVMTTGSHHYQTYWVSSGRYDRLLQTLPLVYLFKEQRWIPREAAFMRGPQDTNRFITQWNHHCIRCHSTGGNPGLVEKTGMLDSSVGELGIACEACHGPGAAHVQKHNNPLERYRLHLTGAADTSIVNPARLDHRRSSEVCAPSPPVGGMPYSRARR